MKKLLVLFIIFTLFLSGCGIYNLNYFVLPDDSGFLALIEELDTPKKISDYMIENFTYEIHLLYAPNPYILWQNKKGDCDDFAHFGMFIANHHDYETFLVKIQYEKNAVKHYIAIYKENNLYNFSDNQYYYFVGHDNFHSIVIFDSQLMYNYYGYILSRYTIYDYDMNVIEQGIK